MRRIALFLAVLCFVAAPAGAQIVNAPGGGTVPSIGYWQVPVGSTFSTLTASANQTLAYGQPIPVQLSIGHITFSVTAADVTGGDVYSVGLYDSSGNLKASCSAAAYTTTGLKTCAISQGTVTLPAGLYYLAYTGNASSLQISTSNTGQFAACFGISTSAGASSAGALPSTITAPSPASPTNSGCTAPWFLLTP